MGILSFWRKKTDKDTEERRVIFTPGQNPPFTRTSNQYVNPYDATLGNGNTAYYRSLVLISNQISSLPFSIYQKTDKGREQVKDHPVSGIFKRWISPYQTGTEFLLSLIQDALSWGNGYGIISRNGYGDIQIYYVRPSDIRVEVQDNERIYTYIPSGEQINKDNIIHLRNNGNAVSGYSPLSLFALQLATDTGMEKAIHDFYENGMKTSWLVTSPSLLKSEVKANVAKSLTNAFDPETKAPAEDKRLGVSFLEGALKAERSTISPLDAQLLQSMQFGVVEISRIFGVPLHKLSDLRDANNNTLEKQGTEFLQDCLQPWIQRLEEQINLKLLTEEERQQGYYCRFNVDGLLRSDRVTRYQGYATAIQWGFLTRNQVRQLEDLEADDTELDKYLQPVNMQTVGESQGEEGDPPGEAAEAGDTDVRSVVQEAIRKAGWQDENRISQLTDKIMSIQKTSLPT